MPEGVSSVLQRKESSTPSQKKRFWWRFLISRTTTRPPSYPHRISETAIPFPMASSRSVSMSSMPSIPLSCSSTNSAISLSRGSSPKAVISKSRPVTAFFRVWSWLNRWGSCSSISSNSSICRMTSPVSASRKISARRTGVSPLDGYSLYLSWTRATVSSRVSGLGSGGACRLACCGLPPRFFFAMCPTSLIGPAPELHRAGLY